MSNSKPTITVAIPSYNKERYIERCLDSILLEKDQINQIILVDNCSTDNTFNLAKKYGLAIQCYKNEKNLGMSGNWNRCIELCKTDWLMILHADDELLPGAINQYIDFINSYPSVRLIHANSYAITEGDGKKQLWQRNEKKLWKAGLDALSCPNGVCSAVFVRKDVYDKLGYFLTESLSSDVEMWLRIASVYDVGYLNFFTVIYHINPSSTGYDSLINRNISEIKIDWDILNKHMANCYPDKESKELFLDKVYRQAPYSYWPVVKANLKAKNYFKVLRTVFFIIFIYNGFIPLIKLSLKVIKKKYESRRAGW